MLAAGGDMGVTALPTRALVYAGGGSDEADVADQTFGRVMKGGALVSNRFHGQFTAGS